MFKLKTPTLREYLFLIPLAALVYYGTPWAKAKWEARKEHKYRMEHLDPNAVSPEENPFKKFRIGPDRLRVGVDNNGDYIDYKDTDKDGDFDSILLRKNSDGEFVKIPIRKGLEGKIEFPNLAEKAVKPLNFPEFPPHIKIDYINVKGNEKLESITYFGNFKNPQKILVEVTDGKYSLSNL